jgi:hypothetical protein
MPTCRPGSSVLDGLQPGRQAQHGERDIHIAASSETASRRSTPAIRDWEQAIAPQVPEQVLVPATVPSQTHTDSSVPCTPQTVHRGTVNVGTWNVRSESAEARSQTCGRELDSTSKDITVCAIQETWLDPNRHRHDPGFSYWDCWVRN